MPLKVIPPVGTKVRLTGKFLRNTGQTRGGEGTSTWVTVESPEYKPGDPAQHKHGGFHLIAVNEPHECQRDPSGYEDVAPEERPKWRRINAANLEVVGSRPQVADYP